MAVSAELRSCISSHSFWKQGTAAMFDIRSINLDVGSYLRTAPKKAMENVEKGKSAKGPRMCTSGVSSRCDSPAAISDQSRDGQAMAGGALRLSTTAGPSGGRKRKGETPTEEFCTSSTVSFSSQQAQEMVERYCSCTLHSTCSTTGPSPE